MIRRYERLSPDSVKDIKGIIMHLGNIETKLGILEGITKKTVEMTQSTQLPKRLSLTACRNCWMMKATGMR